MQSSSRESLRTFPSATRARLSARILQPQRIDPYSAAVSDVYQDLFGEGSYAGKGIYAVDAFETVLADRVPDSTLLSHDLFEGVFARAGLASDVEVVEILSGALRRRLAALPSLGPRRLATAALDPRLERASR